MTLQYYDKFELYLNSIKDADFTSLVQQIEKPVWSICHMNLDDVHIQYGRENSGHIASGNIRTDGWVFFLMLIGKSARANGLDLEEDAAFIIPPGNSFHITTQKPHEWLSIFIPSKLLKNVQSNNLSKAYPNNQITSLEPQNLKQFIQRLRRYHSDENSVAIAHKVNTQLLIDLIIKLATNLIDTPDTKKANLGRKILDRHGIITEALCAIHNDKSMGLNIEKLLEATNVSERTLRTVFHEFFGLSPLNYIILVRLNEAKNMIIDPKNSNKTIAFFSSSVGFFDQGRFAKRYKSLFGELPNQAHQRANNNGT